MGLRLGLGKSLIPVGRAKDQRLSAGPIATAFSERVYHRQDVHTKIIDNRMRVMVIFFSFFFYNILCTMAQDTIIASDNDDVPKTNRNTYNYSNKTNIEHLKGIGSLRERGGNTN